jgi:hypothetical protein
MSTIVTRAVKGSPLTHTEVDTNFTNLNTDKAEDNTVVKLTGDQTVAGTKTFSSTITGSVSGNAGTVTNGVYTTGNQTIGGVKTFSSTITGSISGNAANVTGTVAIANGGTGATTRQNAMDALAGSVTSGQYLRGNGTDVVMSAIQAADVPTLNQSTTGSAATLTTGRTIAITGDLAYTSPSFNGSGNVTAAGTLATVNSNVGTYGSSSSIPVVTVNGKGLVTGVTTATVAGGQYFGTAATKAIAYNSNSIAENITITTGNNAMSVGNLTIASGFSVTVQSGCRWVIL